MSAPGRDWRDRLHEALQAVQQARREPPAAGKGSFREAFKRVVGVRNERLRPGSGSGEPPLDRVNALLSLMSSVEFPLGGYHSERMDLIERQLQELSATDTRTPA